MNKDENTSDGGIGFCGLLAIAFIVMKLTGFIDWSWWWVLAPLWMTLILIVFMLLIIFAIDD